MRGWLLSGPDNAVAMRVLMNMGPQSSRKKKKHQGLQSLSSDEQEEKSSPNLVALELASPQRGGENSRLRVGQDPATSAKAARDARYVNSTDSRKLTKRDLLPSRKSGSTTFSPSRMSDYKGSKKASVPTLDIWEALESKEAEENTRAVAILQVTNEVLLSSLRRVREQMCASAQLNSHDSTLVLEEAFQLLAFVTIKEHQEDCVTHLWMVVCTIELPSLSLPPAPAHWAIRMCQKSIGSCMSRI